jgi:hypothetical protein
MIYEATVVGVDDLFAGGIIQVLQTEINGPAPFSCYAMTPFGGAGAGLYGPVGKGSIVAITKIHTDPNNYYWVYLGAIFNPKTENTSVNINPKDFTEEELRKNDTLSEVGGKNALSQKSFTSHGIPDALEVYEGNGLPQAVILKSPKGHSIALLDKQTDETHKQGIKIRTASGKTIVLEDQIAEPVQGIEPSVSESPDGVLEDITGNRLGLIDEQGNRIMIYADSKSRKNEIELSSKEKIALKTGDVVSVQTFNRGGEINIECLEKGAIKIRTEKSYITLDEAGKVDILGFNINITTWDKVVVPFQVDGTTFGRIPSISINGFNAVVIL